MITVPHGPTRLPGYPSSPSLDYLSVIPLSEPRTSAARVEVRRGSLYHRLCIRRWWLELQALRAARDEQHRRDWTCVWCGVDVMSCAHPMYR